MFIHCNIDSHQQYYSPQSCSSDVAISAPFSDPSLDTPTSGAVYIYHGSTTQLITPEPQQVASHIQPPPHALQSFSYDLSSFLGRPTCMVAGWGWDDLRPVTTLFLVSITQMIDGSDMQASLNIAELSSLTGFGASLSSGVDVDSNSYNGTL